MCRQGIEREVAQTRSAFLIAVTTVGKIRNMTLVWRRGDETARIKEIGALAKKALEDIQELVYKPKEGEHEPDSVNSEQSGGI